MVSRHRRTNGQCQSQLPAATCVGRDVPVRQDDDRLLNRFVEELLRFDPPTRGLMRMTTREVILGEVSLPRGAHLLVLFSSACDDEKEFACPRNFDLNRKNLARHVAFGAVCRDYARHFGGESQQGQDRT